MRISDWSSDVCSSDLHRGRGLIDDADREGHAAAVEMRVIGDLLGQEIGVGDHQQLAVRRADMRALEADALDRPRRIVVFDRLSDAERPVDDDRERGETVGKDALRGETDRDAADAEPGDEAGDRKPPTRKTAGDGTGGDVTNRTGG